jgi:hypothetical protein
LLPKKGSEVLSREQINTDAYLCRRVDNIENLKDEDGNLSPNAIDPEKEYFNLSTNMTPETFVEDIKYRVINPGIKTQLYEKGCIIPKWYALDFLIAKNYGHFFFQINKVQGFNEEIPFNKNRKKISNTTTPFTLYIDHKPMVYNFHHYETSVWFGNEDKSVKGKNEIKEDTLHEAIIHRLRTKFIEISVFELPKKQAS